MLSQQFSLELIWRLLIDEDVCDAEASSILGSWTSFITDEDEDDNGKEVQDDDALTTEGE